MKTSPSQLPQSICTFKERLRSHYGPRLSKVILFGSYARGESKSDSDVDLLLVLKEVTPQIDEMDHLLRLISQFLLETGLLVSVIVKSEDELRSQKEGLMKNIQTEGLLL